MIKVSKGFISAKQARFDEKEAVYGGKENPQNYKNILLSKLHNRIQNQANVINQVFCSDATDEIVQKELVDMSNLCELLWRKLRW